MIQIDNPAAIDTATLRREFVEHGAILFRGMALDQQSLDALTSRFCSRFAFNESRGRKTVSSDGRTRTVNLGAKVFPLHSELAREPWKPDIAFFACATAPASGGETIYCDGVKIAAALRPATRQLLEANQLEHRIPCSQQEYEHWAAQPGNPFDLSRQGDAYFRTFRTPVIHRTLFSQQPAFANFLLFARYFHNIRTFPTFENGAPIGDEICEEIRLAAEPLTVAHQWQQHDVLMLDNTRFMHGRNAVQDVQQRIILTQFGYASFVDLPAEQLARQPWRNPTHG